MLLRSVVHGIPVHVLVRVTFVDFDTVVTDLGAVAPIAESTVARCVTVPPNDRKMNCETVEQGQNEQPLTILPRISLKFPDIQTISPINLINFELQLTSHPDRRKVDYVLNGLRFGFHLGFQPHLCKLKSAASNCPSANEHPAVIDEYLKKEVSLGRVFGPTHAPPLQNLHVSRFGVIPKKGNAWRLILDLSFPVEHSVNDGIDKDDFSFQYCTVKHAINLIIKTGKGALMGKVDIKSAYRIIPVNPSDRYLLGMHWKGKYYVSRGETAVEHRFLKFPNSQISNFQISNFQISKFPNFKFPNFQISNFQISNFRSAPIPKFLSYRVFEPPSLQVTRFTSLRVTGLPYSFGFQKSKISKNNERRT